MKNLKRALSFALASVMVIGMMVVGAGAAFTDADKIVNEDAVNTLVALNVINGKGDGSYFDPAGSLTRAEMAKLAVYILHGGKDPVIGTKETPSFTDIKGTWAEAYIEYCASTGIIAGKGDGTFGPTDVLTGSQAAKMLMVAMGYNADVFGFTGSSWEINTNIEANKIGLYEDLEDMNPSAVITRDNAAQLVYNAIFAGTMHKSYSHNIATGAVENGYSFNTSKTLFSDKFGGKKQFGFIEGISYDSEKGEYTYALSTADFGATITEDALTISSIKSTVDYSALYGQKVAVVYKDAATDVLYGIYSEATLINEGQLGDVTAPATATDKKVKFDGVEYELTAAYNATPVYAFNTASSTYDMADVQYNVGYDTFAAYDNTGDGKADVAIWFPITVAKVNYVGTKSVTTAAGTFTFEDDNIVDGLKKDDYVAITAAANTVDNKDALTKVEFVTGTVAGIKDTDSVKVNDVWYKDAANVNPTLSLNKEYKFAAVGNYYFSMELTSEDAAIENLVLVTDYADVSMGLQTVKFLTAANETVVKTVSKIGGNDVVDNSNEISAKGGLYTYKEKDGNWELTLVNDSNDLGYTYNGNAGTYTAATTKVDAKLGSAFIDDGAVIFVNNTTAATQTAAAKQTFKAVTGATANDWAAAYGDSAIALTKKVNGINYVYAAVIVEAEGSAPAASGETGNYGYVVTDSYKVKVGDDTYDTYDIWNGTKVVTVMDKDNDAAIVKGNVISYTDLGDGYIKDTTTVGTPAAITGFTATALDVEYANSTDSLILDDDTVYMYIDAENVAGVEGGALALAVAPETDGEFTMNAYVYADNSTKIVKLVVIEVANDLGLGTTN